MNTKQLSTLSVLCACATVANAQNTVYSNNLYPGDFFTNAGGTPANQAIAPFVGPNGEVFTYRETKNGGIVGINAANPRSGNGSVQFVDNGSNVKSEIAMSKSFDASGNSTGLLGAFDSLSAWSADTLTNSTNVTNGSPVLRLELFSANDGGSASYGQLVFDTGWTPSHSPTITNGVWTNMDLFGNAGSMWMRGTSHINTLYDPGTGTNHERTLANWMTLLSGKGYGVISANAGVGTFTGTFDGAMDNLKLGFGSNVQSFNFEALPVPEPATLSIVGLGALAMIRRRRNLK